MRIEQFIADRLDEVERRVAERGFRTDEENFQIAAGRAALEFLSRLTTEEDRDQYRKVLHWPASDWADHPDYRPEWAKA